MRAAAGSLDQQLRRHCRKRSELFHVTEVGVW